MDGTSMITFFAGEQRMVSSRVVSRDPQEVIVIREAAWTLTDRGSGEIVDAGDCEIDGATMCVLIGSEIAGLFRLEITAKVGREEIKQRCGVMFH